MTTMESGITFAGNGGMEHYRTHVLVTLSLLERAKMTSNGREKGWLKRMSRLPRKSPTMMTDMEWIEAHDELMGLFEAFPEDTYMFPLVERDLRELEHAALIDELRRANGLSRVLGHDLPLRHMS